MRLCSFPYISLASLALTAQPARAAIYFETSTDFGPIVTFIVAASTLSVLALILFKIFGGQSKRQKSKSAAASSKEGNFTEQAAARGFRQTETKLLEQIAGNMPSNMGSDLLESAAGRDYLARDLEKRISRRQREIELIRRIQTKLEKMGADELTPRATVRVDADMRIWVAKKLQHSLAPGEESEEGEDVFTEIEPVTGRLQDISEGGAALTANLPVDRGDMIEFWSADSDIVLSPITAIIIDIKSQEGREDLLHLHFMDPPLGELRSAIYALQSRNETRTT